MLYRITTIGIVAFWLVMMGLLVRLETHPEETGILDVPVPYVMRIIFKNGQRSVLSVSDDTGQIGTAALHPSVTGSDGRSLDFSGTLSLRMPISGQQRLNASGAVDMNAALQVRGFHVDLAILQPPCRLSATGNMAANSLAYRAFQGKRLVASGTLPMDPAALSQVLSQSIGLGPNALPISQGSISLPTATAREAEISLHGEQLQVYEVTIHEGASTALDFYVTQLGQIVLAKTNLGYTFSNDDLQ
ncbi:MAG: hypothetical protein ABSE62_11755 [Chthoniobacteraceae bacterium]|jgi:hypothetical protein